MARTQGGVVEATSHEISVLHVMTWIQIMFDSQATLIKTHGNLPAIGS